MTDWLRELDDSSSYVKYREHPSPIPTKPTKLQHSIRTETDSQRYKSATSKLLTISEELGWPLSDLQDWYKNDLADIANMDIAALRFVVQDYIKNHVEILE